MTLAQSTSCVARRHYLGRKEINVSTYTCTHVHRYKHVHAYPLHVTWLIHKDTHNHITIHAHTHTHTYVYTYTHIPTYYRHTSYKLVCLLIYLFTYLFCFV